MSQGNSIKSLNPLTIRPFPTDYEKSRWAALEKGLKRNVDRSPYHVDTISLKDNANALTDQILASYQTCGSDSKATWMKRLAQDSIKFLAQKRGVKLRAVREETMLNQATSDLVNRTFDLLQAYSFDFNHELGWNELRITCTKPAFVTEILRCNKFREPIETITNFRARLSTRFMSLVIRGRRNTIEFLFLPVDKVIGLSKSEVAYEPSLQLKAEIVDGEITWKVGDEPLSDVQLQAICMDLFTNLIEKTKSESQVEH